MAHKKEFNFAKFIIFLLLSTLLYFAPACQSGNCAGGLETCQFHLPPENFLFTFAVGLAGSIQGYFEYLFDLGGVVLIALGAMKIDDAMESRGYKLWSRMVMGVVFIVTAGVILAVIKLLLIWGKVLPCDTLAPFGYQMPMVTPR